MLFFYIISTILSLYMGVLFFKTLNLKEILMSEEELKQYIIKNNISTISRIDYRKKYKYVPIGLPLWLLFLIIIWSFFPIVNIISVVILLIIMSVSISDSYNNTFEKAFEKTTKLNKLLKFLNKKL